MSKTAKNLPEDCPKFYIKIVKHDCPEITRHRTEPQWDNDDVVHSWDIEGFEVVDEKDSWDFIVNEKPEGEWYLVFVLYSTGDSFHHEEGAISLVEFTKHRACRRGNLTGYWRRLQAF